ncbi:hypothetical protein ONS95_011521 [Cadophora gregata]|uniref:uncharacterized protein n=1 Tax=Cadophora gregata TaxID=51156 RepID=UPI0026DAC3C5|nr:uncharacterized protein ONS95_011521 [Cadophora gregata]KAK0120112.1 hypothetical protein ONS95_011521 [Cadophora gregata]KAK0121140.1 hypothetical protein ONS96_011320 [Cadophora gregata f. sp. sojae]
MEELQARLIEEYSQSIETSTLLAILYDYDIKRPTELAAARNILDILKSSASEEESTGFDPSGASGPQHGLDDGSVRDEVESQSASQRESRTQTDDTSLSQDPGTLDLEGLDLEEGEREESTSRSYSSELDKLDQAGKEQALIGIFPALKPFDITWTLKKCKGDAGLAIDELMTQAFLEESGSRHRGVDAFSESDIAPRRKGKGKKKRAAKIVSNPTTPPSPVESPSESKWNTGKQDIEFISDKTGIPDQQVTSLYHKHGGTARGTIAAIIQAHAEMGIYEDDPIVAIDAYGLHQDFPSISIADLEILLHITNHAPSARDLAKALATPVNKENAILLDIRHAPIQLDSEPAAKPKSFNAVYHDGPHDFAGSSQAAARYSESRNVEFAKAADAFRKAKSNPLMGGAAAYYSEVGRTYDTKAKAAASRAADALVASQSSKLVVDLHGMNVKDATRISRERVTMWWHEHGEERADGRSAKVPPYKIVTGAGNHSAGGGKLGPAVAKMLLAEGWKIQVGSGNNMGFLLVLGISRRK